MKKSYSISDLLSAADKAWSLRSHICPDESGVTYYKFTLNSSGHWYDPIYEKFLYPLLAHCRVDIIPPYVDYCLIHTEVAELKYRKYGNSILLVVKLL